MGRDYLPDGHSFFFVYLVFFGFNESSSREKSKRGEEEKIEEPEENDENMKQEEDADERDFIAAKAFRGIKPGFVFKRGSRGTGYYRDGAGPKEDKENDR